MQKEPLNLTIGFERDRKYPETNKSAKEGGDFAVPFVFKSFLQNHCDKRS